MSMERDKLIKLIVAGVIGLAAIVLLAVNFLGGPPRRASESDAGPPPSPTERRGGGSATPEGLEDE